MTTTDWTPPGWDITLGAVATDPTGWRSVQMTCRAEDCTHTTYTGVPPTMDPARLQNLQHLRNHQEQHRPGRALDIEVDWTPSASCSVCPDGVGTVEQEDGGLVCRECGTTWDRDGTEGERAEKDD